VSVNAPPRGSARAASSRARFARVMSALTVNWNAGTVPRPAFRRRAIVLRHVRERRRDSNLSARRGPQQVAGEDGFRAGTLDVPRRRLRPSGPVSADLRQLDFRARRANTPRERRRLDTPVRRAVSTAVPRGVGCAFARGRRFPRASPPASAPAPSQGPPPRRRPSPCSPMKPIVLPHLDLARRGSRSSAARRTPRPRPSCVTLSVSSS